MTSLAQTLKQYFDIAIETDPALKEVYDEKKLDECGKYINNRARKLASNNMAMVESSVVFKWARDFFYGDMEDENAKPEIDKGGQWPQPRKRKLCFAGRAEKVREGQEDPRLQRPSPRSCRTAGQDANWEWHACSENV